jgi:uncharacterized membrane protein
MARISMQEAERSEMDMQVSHRSLATPSADGVCWFLRRNCSVTPRQLGAMFLSLCVLSLAVSLFFWFRGATLVLPFAAIELAAVGTAFVVYARHATDRESICLVQGCLVVEQELAGQLHRCEFGRHGVQVGLARYGERLVELRGDAGVVRVGRFLRPDLRPVLARELRLALRG